MTLGCTLACVVCGNLATDIGWNLGTGTPSPLGVGAIGSMYVWYCVRTAERFEQRQQR